MNMTFCCFLCVGDSISSLNGLFINFRWNRLWKILRDFFHFFFPLPENFRLVLERRSSHLYCFHEINFYYNSFWSASQNLCRGWEKWKLNGVHVLFGKFEHVWRECCHLSSGFMDIGVVKFHNQVSEQVYIIASHLRKYVKWTFLVNFVGRLLWHKIVLFIQFSWRHVSREFCGNSIIEECFRRWLTAKSLPQMASRENQSTKFSIISKEQSVSQPKIPRISYLCSRLWRFSLSPTFSHKHITCILFSNLCYATN